MNDRKAKKSSRRENSKDKRCHLPLPFDEKVPRPSKSEFLRDETPYQKSFAQALKTSYRGFCTDAPEKTMAEVEVQFALSNMGGMYLTDVTQPFGLGTKLAKTYVTRCLLGVPGTTYKYLGLRMFAHSWRADSPNKSARTVGSLASKLQQRTRFHLDQLSECQPTTGRDCFDVCLINRMDSSVASLKPLESGRCTVSWHADSSLEHYSTIAVYQTILSRETDTSFAEENTQAKQQKRHATVNKSGWEVALRVAPHSEGPTSKCRGSDISVDDATPAIAVSLPSAHTYYLLDDFNHHHQHAVLTRQPKRAGRRDKDDREEVCADSEIRYSCTFRLLRESHTVGYILQRCQSVCSNFHKKGKTWRSEQLLLDEVESEWLRQFYIQGSRHKELLWGEWGGHIQTLLQFWSRLEERTFQTINFLKLAVEGKFVVDERCGRHDNETEPPPSKSDRKLYYKRKKATSALEELIKRTPDTDFFESIAEQLESRAKLRSLWTQRERDPVFHSIGKEYRPLPVPFRFQVIGSDRAKEKGTSPMPGSPSLLTSLATNIKQAGQAYRCQDANRVPSFQDLLVTPVTIDNDVSNEHSKSRDWHGWRDCEFALEMQAPWADHLLNGSKTIETRAYSLPNALLGRKILILQSTNGKPGVSSLGNCVSMDKSSNLAVVGWCVFSSVKRYKSFEDFEREEDLHMVQPKSGFCWKKDVDMYGWVVSSSSRVEGIEHSVFTRRFRSLFQVEDAKATGSQLVEVLARKSSRPGNRRPNLSKKRSPSKKKKRRF